jgi:WD40 repeat protein
MIHENKFLTRKLQPVLKLIFSSDGQRLADKIGEERLRIWHLATGKVIGNLQLPPDPIEQPESWKTFDAQTGLPTLVQARVTLTNLDSGTPVLLESEYWELLDFSVSSDNRFVIDKRTLHGWDLQERQPLPQPADGPLGNDNEGFAQDQNEMYGVTFLPHSPHYAIVWWMYNPGFEFITAVIDPLTGEWIGEMSDCSGSFSFSPDGQWMLALLDEIDCAELWKSTEPQQYRSIEKIDLAAAQVSFSADNRHLIAINNNRLQVWEVSELLNRATRLDLSDKFDIFPYNYEFAWTKLTALAFSVNTSRIAVGTAEGEIILLDFQP